MSYEIHTITIRSRASQHYLIRNVYTDGELWSIDFDNFIHALPLDEYEIKTSHLEYNSLQRHSFVLASMRPDYYYVY